MPKEQSSPSSQVQKTDHAKELIQSDQMQTALSEIKKDFSSPSIIDQESNFVEKLYKINQNKELTSEAKTEKRKGAFQDLAMLYGLENGAWVASVDYAKYQPTLIQMRKKITKDYNCTTSVELMLVDSMVTSYWRIIKNERQLNLLIQKEDDGFSYNQQKINIIKELNKQVDLANRRLGMNMILLKEMKQPTLKVNIKTNNAFLGENQQFNNNQNNESK